MKVLLIAAATAIAALTASAAAPGGPVSVEPLAPRSGPRGATMFQVVPPAQSGIVATNRYADPRMWTDHYQELVYGEIGTGVAIGDFDNDGWPDVFVVSKTEASHLFRNLGGWKFADVTEAAGLLATASPSGVTGWLGGAGGGADAKTAELENWRQGATFADVNNDGWLDLYVCRFAAPNLLFVNQRNGTFKEEAAARGLALQDASGMAAFCDYDRDGWLDVYVHTSMLSATRADGEADHLFHNNGDGTFTEVSERAGIRGAGAGHSATWWDYDQDGWPDLYVANDYAPADRLYHNQRDGTFRDVLDQVVPHTPYYAMGADLGDVNNDGLIDFFVTDMAPTTHEKDQRGMAGSRLRAQLEPTERPRARQTMFNALYVATGAGVFQEAARLAGIEATDWTWSPRFEDLDNDGWLDLHVTTGITREYHNADLLDRIMAAENPLEGRRIMKSSPPLSEPNLAFRNRGDLQFENVGAAWGLAQRGVSFGSAFGDLDRDGDLDLVYGNYLTGPTVLRNDSDTGHRLIVALRGTSSNRFGVGAQVRIETTSGVQVRSLVLARGVLSSSEPVLHFGLGNDDTVRRLVVQWPSGRTQSVTDLAADQRITLTEPSAAPIDAATGQPAPARFTPVSTGLGLDEVQVNAVAKTPDQPLIGVRPHRSGPALVVLDGPRNAPPALMLGAVSGTAPQLLRRAAPAGRFAVTSLAAEPASVDQPLVFADFDGDGHEDLLSAVTGGSLQLWRGDGQGSFAPTAGDLVPPGVEPAGALSVADFNRDGRLDCFVGGRARAGEYPLAHGSALLMNAGERFTDATEELAAGLRNSGVVTAALWSDVDDDGWLDLIVAAPWQPLRYWHNDQGRRFEDWSERSGFAAAGSGWWSALGSGDFNADGRPDFVLGNLGLNTRYRASPSAPALIYRGDFGGRTPLSIEAYAEGDTWRAWATRAELAALISGFAKRFPKTDAFAQATLGEIFTAPALEAAQKFAITELRSGVLLSQADGRYAFAPLPRIAQIAPAQSAVVCDFDGDGLEDLFLAQNSHAPVPAVGRFDGGVGQWLRGDGAGRFHPVSPAESGLVVRGDAKSAVALDLNDDGWPDLAVARRDAAVMAFAARPLAGRHSLALTLRDGRGQPAIGARITVRRRDGSRSRVEIATGGGWAQSAKRFFGYTDANAPAEVEVRWPDGSAATYPIDRGAPAITIQR